MDGHLSGGEVRGGQNSTYSTYAKDIVRLRVYCIVGKD